MAELFLLSAYRTLYIQRVHFFEIPGQRPGGGD